MTTFAIDARPLVRSGLATLARRALGCDAHALNDVDKAAAALRLAESPPRVVLLGLRSGDDPAERFRASADAPVALTARCLEVLQSLADGLHDDEIASRLGISTSSVRKHISSAQGRLKARTRTQVVAIVAVDGLLVG